MPVVGISGCGAIGGAHARRLRSLGAALRFQSRTRARAEGFARRFAGEVVSTYEALIEACDAVVLATPPALHADQVVAALAAATPVLAEKPLCLNAGELARLQAAAAAAQAGAFVMVAENYYYKPSVILMRQVIGRGEIGRVRALGARKLRRQGAAGWRQGLGSLLEGGIHFVAQLADLADVALAAGDDAAAPSPAAVQAPATVAARFPTAVPGAPERHVRIRWTYDQGVTAHLHYAWDEAALLQGLFQHCLIEGDAGRIWYENNGFYLHVRGSRGSRLTFPGFGDLMGYGAMMRDFLTCLEGGGTPYSDWARARRDLDIVFRAYRQLPAT